MVTIWQGKSSQLSIRRLHASYLHTMGESAIALCPLYGKPSDILDKPSRSYLPLPPPLADQVGTNDAYIHPGSVSTPLPIFLSHMNHFLTSLTSPSSPYSIASTPVSIILITPHPIILHMRPGFHEPGYVPEQDPTRQRAFRDAMLELGKERKVREGDERWNKSGWKVEVLNLWEVMLRDAGGEGEVLERYYT